MINRKRTNPLHHNAGRVPNFNQSLTCHLSFVNFTCKGLTGNLSTARRLLESDLNANEYIKLPEKDRKQLQTFNRKLLNLTFELQELADDVAEFNRDKTKLVLPPTQKIKMKGGT